MNDADHDDARARGRWLAVDGLARTRFGTDVGDAAERAMARLRGTSPPLERVRRATSSARLRSRHARLRRRTRRHGPLALIAAFASAAAVLVTAIVFGRRDAPAPRGDAARIVEPAPRSPEPTVVATPRAHGGARIAAGRVRRADGAALAGELPEGVEIAAVDDARVVLPDGSTLAMTTGTRLSWSDAADGRRVRLVAGSVDVAAQPQAPERPLRVAADELEATVVGTRFVVAREDAATRVAVAHGRVRVARGGESVEVPAGRAVRTLPALRNARGTSLTAAELEQLPAALATEPAAALDLAAAAATPCADAAARPGLVAQFFAGAAFAETTLTRIDRSLAFHWRPGAGLGDAPIAEPEARGAFSARWSGLLRAPARGSYALATAADDGVRVWLDGRLVIDDWRIHPTVRSAARCDLDIGLHPLVVEYCQVAAHAEIELRWTPPGEDEAIVPADALLHAPCGADR